MSKHEAIHSFLDRKEEQKRLNGLCIGKTIKQITYNDKNEDYLIIYFTNGEHVTLSTFGGIEIEETPVKNKIE